MPIRFARGTPAAGAAALLMTGLTLCGSVLAQNYPTKPIRMLIGFSAGSTTDVLARTVGQKMAEAGVPGYVFDPWFGILAPAKTPKGLLARLNGEIARILQLPDIKERLLALGAEPAPTTPEGFDAHIRAEVAKFRKIVQDAGIKPE